MLPNTIQGTCISSLGTRRPESTTSGKSSNISVTLAPTFNSNDLDVKANIWIEDNENRVFTLQLNHKLLMALRKQLNELVEIGKKP
jgi:hypothetical protein